MSDFKGYNFLEKLCLNNPELNELITKSIKEGKIRRFDNREWDLIKSQNYFNDNEYYNSFYELFEKGYNEGNCKKTAYQLSFSYDDVDIVSGILPILKGTVNAEKEGGHVWLENKDYIIDTSLLLVIDKELKEKFGYIEEERINFIQLRRNEMYQMRKEMINMKSKKK